MEFTSGELASILGNISGAVYSCFIVSLLLYGAIWKLEEEGFKKLLWVDLDFIKDFLFSSNKILFAIGTAFLVAFIAVFSVA